MPDQAGNAELITWLENDEKASREWRARRLRHLMEVIQTPEEGVLFHGELSFQSFNEVRLAYIHGLYLATILLSLTCIEQELSGQLYAAGWERAKKTQLKKLLVKAHEFGILSETELDTFQRLRNVRNAYAHFRAVCDSSSLLHRSVDQHELPNDVIETDAQQAIEALGSFFGRK